MTPDIEWTIETRDLTRIYGSGLDEVRALDGLNLRVAPGEFLAIMGPSGSGKSTLLNVLGALDIPTSGEVYINGQNLLETKDKDTFRAKTVGFVFQLHNLLPTMTAVENVEVPMMQFTAPGERRVRAEELLSLVGMLERKKHLPSQLSGGQRQRVAIARALANRPALILADEPTGNLDTANGQELLRLMRDLNENHDTTFIIVTHDSAVAAQTKRVVTMADGKITHDEKIGSPLEEDLKLWQHSSLGRLIVNGDGDALSELGIKEEQLKVLRKVLNNGEKKK
jgi:ABC-type lipoprotein export system ATPase subunit